MKNNLLKRFKVYFPIILFILGWWGLAFHKNHIQEPLGNDHPKSHEFSSTFLKLKALVPKTTRQEFQQALRGDFKLIMELITKWDIDAKILQNAGLHPIQLLNPDLLFRSQEIGRAIFSKYQPLTSVMQDKQRPEQVIDDTGKSISLRHHYQSFLPQTYTAASFLLALIPSDQIENKIIALPGFLRQQSKIYPIELTEKISMDIDRYNAEKIYLKHPDIAFVANYSHPATVQALSNQSILIYTMRDPLTLNDIVAELINVGHLVNRSLEAELLAIFMDAAMLNLDNHLTLTASHYTTNGQPIPKMLFLNYYRNFYVPTMKNLTGQLLSRLKEWDISLEYLNETENNREWMMPIDKEKILKLNPDYLLIASEDAKVIHFHQTDAFQHLKAVKNNHLHFLDEAVQQSPSQYLVLAYYDIVDVLIKDHDDTFKHIFK